MGKLRQVEYSLRKTGLGMRRGYDKKTLKKDHTTHAITGLRRISRKLRTRGARISFSLACN